MRTLFVLAFASLTLAGCAGMGATECRNANWHDIGFRDGIFGVQRLDNVYATQCGAEPDRVAYAKGWQEGVWESDQRRAHGGHD
jgi:hypothetical protein